MWEVFSGSPGRVPESLNVDSRGFCFHSSMFVGVGCVGSLFDVSNLYSTRSALCFLAIYKSFHHVEYGVEEQFCFEFLL